MSYENSDSLLRQSLTSCPICGSESDYDIKPSFHIFQCSVCKVKFMSNELKRIGVDIQNLSLFSLPEKIADETLSNELKDLKFKSKPLAYWFETEFPKKYNENIKKYFIIDSETIYHLNPELKVIRHGEKFEPTKWFLRIDLARDMKITNDKILFLKDGIIEYELPISNIKRIYKDAMIMPLLKIETKDSKILTIVFQVLSASGLIKMGAFGAISTAHYYEKFRVEIDNIIHLIQPKISL